MAMNYIKHLTGFFDKVATDKLLNPTHVSLYISLFQFWNINRFRNPISISRDEIMRISKISSLATYHKCLKLLDAHGYIKYEPSFNPYKGSHVYLFNFSDDVKPTARNSRTASSNFKPVTEQAINKHYSSTDTSHKQLDEQALVPYINNTNNTNGLNSSKGLNLGKQAKKNEDGSSLFLDAQREEKEKGSAEKEKEEMRKQLNSEKAETYSFPFVDSNYKGNGQKELLRSETEIVTDISSTFLIQNRNPAEFYLHSTMPKPTIDEVFQYFREQNYPEVEANKFFNYFKSIGWLVGGKTPMTDWQAAASNWMLNAPNFSKNDRTERQKSFDTSAGKDYSEPL